MLLCLTGIDGTAIKRALCASLRLFLNGDENVLKYMKNPTSLKMDIELLTTKRKCNYLICLLYVAVNLLFAEILKCLGDKFINRGKAERKTIDRLRKKHLESFEDGQDDSDGRTSLESLYHESPRRKPSMMFSCLSIFVDFF